MDRTVSRRRFVPALLAILLCLGQGPAMTALARPPMISDEPAGDPGDGVLRPADSDLSAPIPAVQSEASAATGSPTASATTSSTSPSWLLLPVPGPAGQPWPIVFRLVRVDRAQAAAWWPDSFGGRWHRAP